MKFKNWLKENGEQLNEVLSRAGVVQEIKDGYSNKNLVAGNLLLVGGVAWATLEILELGIAAGVASTASTVVLVPVAIGLCAVGLVLIGVTSNFNR